MLKLHWIGRCNHCYMLDLYKRLDQLPLSICLYKLTFCSCKGGCQAALRNGFAEAAQNLSAPRNLFSKSQIGPKNIAFFKIRRSPYQIGLSSHFSSHKTRFFTTCRRMPPLTTPSKITCD